MGSVTSNPRYQEFLKALGDNSSNPIPGFLRTIADYEREFVIYDNGWRGWSYSYGELARIAENIAERLLSQGVQKGDRVIICSENRPGYVAALWGCMLAGIIIVPIELQSSPALIGRIVGQVNPRAFLLGERAPTLEMESHILTLRLSEIENTDRASVVLPSNNNRDDVAELIFTSGTTADPKGVIMTNRNLAACIRPIESQLAPYRKYLRFFTPLRILNLLPMSHLFGQVMTLFVIPLLPASVMFLDSTNPEEIARQIAKRKICALIAVPRVLEVLRTYIIHRFPSAQDVQADHVGWKKRWWKHRAIHRFFGWRFCCVVVGGAPLPAELEQFWSNLGFVVAQGYGLTETAPIVSFNHPFHPRRGTVGKPIAGIDIKLSPEGEILVRGDSVTPGYYQLPHETTEAFEDGWLHTGDLGEIDSNGDLIIRGRKKDLIVSPDGLKVFPDDVERVLNKIEGVTESAVVNKQGVHAVLVLAPGADGEDIIQNANQHLESHQKIRSFSKWLHGPLPRTESTQKLRRQEVLKDILTDRMPQTTSDDGSISALVARYAPGRTITADTTLEDLGLGSLDRVELMLEMESRLSIPVEDGALLPTTRVSELAQPSTITTPILEPRYNRYWLARLARRAILPAIIFPLTRMFARVTVSGQRNLEAIKTPVIFAANHQSYIDVAIILMSLPARWRYCIAPAMWKEYFDAHFFPDRYSLPARIRKSIAYALTTTLFNAFPMSQVETGTLQTLRYVGELAEDGWSILIFPEGERTLTGDIKPFAPGFAMIAARTGLPLVPIRIIGADQVWHRDSRVLHPGKVEVRIGSPITLKGNDYKSLAKQAEKAVRQL